MKKNKKESLILGALLKKVAPKIGAHVFVEPEWGIAGQITFKNGAKSYFRYNTLDLNPVGSSDIAKDKDYANLFMKRMGYRTVPGSKAFFSREWAEAIGAPKRGPAAAYRYASQLGLPVIVKPNSGSQGRGVALASTKKEFDRALKEVFKQDRVALIQRPVRGRDYRIVVLDGRVISAYERIPLNVTGDGKRPIRALLNAKQAEFLTSKRDTQLNLKDPRIVERLRREGLTLASIPAKGRDVYLLDNANLSSGGDAVDVLADIHPEFARLAVRLTRDMGLRLAGVDLMVAGTITNKPSRYWILEINAAPGLDHYVKTGEAQKKVVENLYLEVLKGIERGLASRMRPGP